MAQILGIANAKLTRWPGCRRSAILASAGLIITSGLFVGRAWPADIEPTPDAAVAGSEAGLARGQDEAPLTAFAELARSLAAAQDRLQELSRLTKGVAAERTELNALRARSQEMLGQIRAANIDRQQLRDARDAALTRAEDLSKAVEQATGISQALAVQLAEERKALAKLQRELAGSEERLADATEQRARAEAELDALASRFAEAEQQITSLKTRVASEQDENDRLAAELAGYRSAAKTAAEVARQHQRAIESAIRELNKAANLAQPAEPEASHAPQERRSGPMGVVPGPEASSGGAADDPQPAVPALGGGYPLTSPANAAEPPPARAAEPPGDDPLQVRLVDALTKQREQLQEWMKKLDDDLQ